MITKIHTKKLKAVQLITGRFHFRNWLFENLGEEPFKNCPESRCYAFRTAPLFHIPEAKSDAIIVHGPNLWYMPSKNYKRNPKQLWMFYTMEPQRLSFCSNHYKYTDLDNWFNLTATFKTDSDIILDYKEFTSLSDIENNSEFLENYKSLKKSKDLVSNINDAD